MTQTIETPMGAPEPPRRLLTAVPDPAGLTMVQAINRNNFQNRQVATCWTCHRGRDVPVLTQNIEKDIYGTPELDMDDQFRQAFAGEPPPDQIIDKYLTAVGGTQRAPGSWAM